MRQWPLFLLGALLFLLGPIIFVVQFNVQMVNMPWHVPILATLGVLLMAVSVWQRGGIWRGVGLGLFALLCGREWFMLVVGTKTPAYTGPAIVDHQVPAFATTLADGTSFTDQDLAQGKPTLLVFFRGHW